MTSAERDTHVIRILGTNKDGEVLPDIWADVERTDRMEIMTQVIQGPGGAVEQYQKVKIKLRWLDDPDGQDYDQDGDRNRKHKIVKVCDPSLPQEQLEDPDEWIPIRSIELMEVKHAGGSILKHFKESQPNSDDDSRVIANRRITHWDTSIDEAAQAAFDADPTRKVYVVKGREYERIEDSEDESQYVEHQIVKKLNRQDAQQLLSTGNDQRRVLYLKNQYQIDESHPAKLKELGKDDINPPYRLDPFQNIINIQLKSLSQSVLSTGGLGLFGSEAPNPGKMERSKDGAEWTGLDDRRGSAAYGLGYAVIANGKQVVFGKPRDGSACFILADGSSVQRGVLDESGELTWSTVASTDGLGVLSFAGGAFFVSYQGDESNALLSVSFDGTNFTDGVNAFGPAPLGYNDAPGLPYGGAVAHDPKNNVYVTTGMYIKWYEFFYHFPNDDFPIHTFSTVENFVSATSIDGLHWGNAHYDDSMGLQPAGGDGIMPNAIGATSFVGPSVAFGAGVFVAATYVKFLYPDKPVGSSLTFMETLAGFATSTDGRSWSNHMLPDASQNYGAVGSGIAARNGYSTCVYFYKTGGTDEQGYPKGYFLLGSWEDQFGLGPPPTGIAQFWNKQKLYKSPNGTDWELVRTVDDVKAAPLQLSYIQKNFDPDTSNIVRV